MNWRDSNRTRLQSKEERMPKRASNAKNTVSLHVHERFSRGSWLLVLVVALALAWGSQANTQEASPLYRVVLNGKVGYIDKTGKLVIQPQFDSPFQLSFQEGLALVTIGGKGGYIDKAGQYIWAPTR